MTRLRNHRSGGGVGDEGGAPQEVDRDGAEGQKDKETYEKEEAKTTERAGRTENSAFSAAQKETEAYN